MRRGTKKIEHAIAINTTRLELTHFKLTDLPENNFASLANLRHLSISYSRLSTLPENIFVPLIMLQELVICNIHLTCLPEKIFDSFINLHVLNISHNNLTTLPDNIFASDALTNLHTLNISHNRLTTLSESMFMNNSLVKLKNLDLSNNKIVALPETIFDPLINLQSLNISCNQLTDLPDNIFAHIATSLTDLAIYFNHFTSLPSSILDCRNLNHFAYFCYFRTKFFLDIRMQRFVDRIKDNKNSVATVKKSKKIDDYIIQPSTKQSINALFKYIDGDIKKDATKNEIIKECLSWHLSCFSDLLIYLEDTYIDPILFVSFYDVFVKVFGRIIDHPNKIDIIRQLNIDLSENDCKNFGKRLTRMINCLVGFYDDIPKDLVL